MSIILKNEYNFEDLIIGGSLESLLYSYFNNVKILVIDPLYPFKLSTIEYHENLRLLGYSKDEVIYKSEMWERLGFVLSMTGLMIMPNIITSSRKKDDSYVLITDHNKRITINSENTTVFDQVEEKNISVYDWFNVRSGNNHNHKIIEDKSEKFVKNIHFYTPTRIGGNRNMKDLVAESYLLKQDVETVDHSEGIARLKVLRMMKSAGIRGQSNGVSKAGIKQHYALKIEHTHRDFIDDYKPIEDIESIIKTEFIRGEQWNLTKRLFRARQISTLQGSFRLPASL
jgi:hypothetical protein|tara:strand:+ start:2832 stop:3686 length:855 start_codon:yes stop_codon:yes gene_type:complete